MNGARKSTARRWAVVLAGGEGERMRPFTTRWLGGHRPKQYCVFTGRRSMLEHTWERAQSLVGPEKILTVIGRNHRRYLEGAGRPAAPGLVIEQPSSRDTGPGIFLPLTVVMALDPGATVAVLPSDHFIYPNDAFERHLENALGLAERLEDRIVLLAAVPERPEPDYGWIEPGGELAFDPGFSAAGVSRFMEKPGPDEAADFYRRGFLCNTMIMAFKAAAVWRLGKSLFPRMLARFEKLRAGVGAADGLARLEEAYQGMETVNFSRGLLERAARRCVVSPLSGVVWSDWGRPERVIETLNLVGRKPLCPSDALTPAFAAARTPQAVAGPLAAGLAN